MKYIKFNIKLLSTINFIILLSAFSYFFLGSNELDWESHLIERDSILNSSIFENITDKSGFLPDLSQKKDKKKDEQGNNGILENITNKYDLLSDCFQKENTSEDVKILYEYFQQADSPEQESTTSVQHYKEETKRELIEPFFIKSQQSKMNDDHLKEIPKKIDHEFQPEVPKYIDSFFEDPGEYSNEKLYQKNQHKKGGTKQINDSTVHKDNNTSNESLNNDVLDNNNLIKGDKI